VDPTKNATAQITVINHDLVLPGNVTLAPGSIQVFSASVLGTTSQSVAWQLQGAGCSASGACGTITADGTYTAPGTPPTPNSLLVVAISSDDTAQSGAANVTISTGANIQSLHPGLAQFDGGYKIEKLPVGRSYTVYAEPLDGAVDPLQLLPAIQNLCRNASTDAGWPPQFSCVVPPPSTQFTVRTLPGP
jgi:hypothetical protein